MIKPCGESFQKAVVVEAELQREGSNGYDGVEPVFKQLLFLKAFGEGQYIEERSK